jgi:Transposase DDE domain
VEAERVYGRINQDWGSRRFTLKGIEKVQTEWDLLCIAYNLAKLAAQGPSIFLPIINLQFNFETSGLFMIAF